MAFLVKGHGGAHIDAFFVCVRPVEHGGHVPVIPDIVCAPAVDWDGGIGGEYLWLFRLVFYGDVHNFHIVIPWDKGCDRSRNLKLL